jgi:phosphotransferase system enzyme I (PtsP)
MFPRYLGFMSVSPPEGVRIHVHEQGDRSLDSIIRLVGLAGQPRHLADVLRAMCGDMATIARADVVSVYVRENADDGDVFTMRGNVGFPEDAVGRVHLRLGEGITGYAAARLRPVSVASAERDEHFKYIPGLGEERFPALLAVPVTRGDRAAGVLVLQRREAQAFSRDEVALATALAAVINHALERAEERARVAEVERQRSSARLRGVALVPGAAMGKAEVLPTLAMLTSASDAASPSGVSLEEAVEKLEGDLRRLARNASPTLARTLVSLFALLDDRRFRDRLGAACVASEPLRGLTALARDYARVAFSGSTGDEDGAAWLAERAGEVEDLCVAVYAAMWGKSLGRAGSIVVAEGLGAFAAVCAIARGASAFVAEAELDEHAPVVGLVGAAGVPLVAGVAGVFSWVRPGDLLVVDGDAATVRVNPPATAVARFRRGR